MPPGPLLPGVAAILERVPTLIPEVVKDEEEETPAKEQLPQHNEQRRVLNLDAAQALGFTLAAWLALPSVGELAWF